MLVFVYGTLKRGGWNNFRMPGEFVREAETIPRYRIFTDGTLPYLTENYRYGLAVRGEVWLVDEDGLAYLDRLEGVDRNFYRRDEIFLADGSTAMAYFACHKVDNMTDCGREYKPPDWD